MNKSDNNFFDDLLYGLFIFFGNSKKIYKFTL